MNPQTNVILLFLLLFTLAGCSSSTSIVVKNSFPEATLNQLDVKASIVFDDNFKSYIATPDAKTKIDIGAAQTQLLTNIFQKMFESVEFVSSTDAVSDDSEIVLTLAVHDVQVSNPSINYLNVFEVWIKYHLAISTSDAKPIATWSMPAYGKTPDSFLLSKTEAVQDATVVALRDVGANLALDFHRIPALENWLEERKRLNNELDSERTQGEGQ